MSQHNTSGSATDGNNDNRHTRNRSGGFFTSSNVNKSNRTLISKIKPGALGGAYDNNLDH